VSVENISLIFDKAKEIINCFLHPKDSFIFVFGFSQKELLHQDEQKPLLKLLEISEDLRAPEQIYLLPTTKTLPDDYACGVIIPIISKQKNIGVIVLKNKITGRLYNSEDVKLLGLIAAQMAIAVEKMNIKEESLIKEKENKDERERISREIHDGIGAVFTNALMMTDLIGEEIATNKNNGKIEELKCFLKRGLTELRDLVWAVEEKECSLGEFVLILKEKTEHLSGKENKNFEMKIEIENEHQIVSPLKKLNILRIIQESVTNIIKHAKAEKIFIHFKEETGGILLKIIDNGKGFETRSRQSKKGHGLINMEKRCSEIGAEFIINSETGKGTALEIKIPRSVQIP
jgi:signal transduction histidine kinase